MEDKQRLASIHHSSFIIHHFQRTRRMKRLRTFIALDLGKTVRDKAVALQESLARAGSDVKWVEPENLHVTLLFLGEVDDRDVPAVCRTVADCCREHAPFTMSV